MKALLFVLIASCPFLVIGQTITENYVKSTTYKQPYTAFQVNNGGIDQDHQMEVVAYFDGLGRPTQSIIQRVGAGREDMVSHVEYDSYGRSLKSWLPMPITTGTGNYYIPQAGVIDTEIKAFYTAKFPDDFFQPGGHVPDYDNPYSESLLDDSPLGRVLETGAPGFDWRIHQGGQHTIKYEYDTNRSATEVYKFSVDINSGTPTLVYDGYYSVGTLSRSRMKDENWEVSDGEFGTRLEYKDKLGRVVLKRASVYDANKGPSVPNYHDTHYVYDDYGNLTYVLSPEVSDKIVVSNALTTNYVDIIDDLGYQYRYDDRNRIIWKKTAGKGYEIILYDLLDRPVLSQDAKMRADDSSKFLFTKYDRNGRVAYTGLYDSPTADVNQIRTSLQNQTYYYENQTTSSNSIGGANIYYSYQAFPTTNMEALTVQYYDTYVDYSGMLLPSTVMGQTRTIDNKGQATVSKVKVLGQNEWITSLVAYDEKGRAIYSSNENDYLETTDKVEMLLGFTGKVQESKAIHTKVGNDAIITWDYFYYDHAQRLLSHKQQIDSEPLQLISENLYDDLGRLKQKNVGGQTALDGYTDLTLVDITFDGTAEKTNSQNVWNAGLKTRGEIIADGGVQFTALANDKIILAGLLKLSNASTGWDRFNFAIYLSNADTNFDGLKDVKVKIGDILGPVVSGYKADDVFTVVREGQYIRFKKNGTQFDSYVETAGESMVGKAAIYSAYGTLADFELFGGDIDKKLQDIEYSYNVRGWLTQINEVKEDGISNAGTDLFHLKLNYNKVEDNTTAAPLFNGNIAQGFWQTRNDDVKVRGYNYSYDNLNRIKIASSLKGDHLDNVLAETIGHNLGNISYDLNGNILGMTRKGSDDAGVFNTWDALAYTYDGNQLTKVVDNADGPPADFGFKDGANTGDDYNYDVNGNMTLDNNKGITAISYSHLNLPEVVTVNSAEGTGTITYIYDATGIKQAKLLSTQTATIGTYYAGNHIYEGADIASSELKFFGQPEGYVEPVAGTNKEVRGFTGGQTTYSSYNYVFQYTDHLGNVRLSYADADLNGAIDPDEEIVEENNYYPFGLKQKGYNNIVQPIGSDLAQKWKFNGIEKNDDLGLNLYEMDLRQYDPTIARWTGIDPVTHHSNSTYNAFDNNPVFWADPSGANSSGPTRQEGFYNQKVYNASETSYLYQYNQPNYLSSCASCNSIGSGGGLASGNSSGFGFAGGEGFGAGEVAGDGDGRGDEDDNTNSEPPLYYNWVTGETKWFKNSEEAKAYWGTTTFIWKGLTILDFYSVVEKVTIPISVHANMTKEKAFEAIPDAAELNAEASYTFQNGTSFSLSFGVFTEAHPEGFTGIASSMTAGGDTDPGFSGSVNFNLFYAKSNYNNGGSYLTLTDLQGWESNTSVGIPAEGATLQINGINSKGYWGYGFGLGSSKNANFSLGKSYTPTFFKSWKF